MSLLEVDNLSVNYGAIEAIRGCSLRVEQGEIVTLIGGNGAGKSTTLRTISGLLTPKNGTIRFDGQTIHGRPPHAITQSGLIHVPEGRGIFANLTVEENLMLAWEIRPSGIPFPEAVRAVFSRFPRLEERRTQFAGNLSGGEQQMLALARAVINRPKLLLVDEPSLGLSPILTKEVFQVLREFRDAGVTILIVEQNVRSALALSNRAYVLSQGVFTAEGSAAELANNPAIVAGYLGHGTHTRPAS